MSNLMYQMGSIPHVPTLFLTFIEFSYFCLYWNFNEHVIGFDFGLNWVFDSCKSLLSYSRFWPGYLFLCLELDRRTEAFTNIIHLDDLSLLNEEDG